MNFFYSILNPQDCEQIVQYEKTFFQAFIKYDSPLLHKIWYWDYENERLKTLISYQEQLIYLCHDNQNRFLGAMAVNLNQEINQFSQFGFKIEKPSPKIAEIITMFKNPECHSPWWKFYNRFIKYAYKHLTQYDIKEIYANCASERLLRTYQRGSWKLIDTKFIGQDVLYFLHLDLFAPETVKLMG